MNLNRMLGAVVASLTIGSVAYGSPTETTDDGPIAIDEEALSKFFTPEEILAYKEATQGSRRVTSAPDEENRIESQDRLTDPRNNRCGDNNLPIDDCPGAQDIAWNNGNGCINGSEYNYAREHAIAPLCNPVHPELFAGWCRCGCFEKSTTLFTRNRASGDSGEVKVPAISTDRHEVYAMTEGATLDEPKLQPRELWATTAGEEKKPLVWVNLENGGSIGLTEEHAVLLSTGEMIPARALDPQQHQLVTRYGEFESIESIDRVETSDSVYNVLTDAKLDHAGHVVVANGILVGDIMWQNTLAADLWKVVVRM